MKSLLLKICPILCFILVVLVAFLTFSRTGNGFPGLNPRPEQLLVSESGDPADRGIEMVYVAGGSFLMGDPTGRAPSALPIRRVFLSDFRISRYEVTFSQYDRYCLSEGLPLPPDGGRGRGKRPVGNISWFDAVEYCNWLSRIEGLQPCYRIKIISNDLLPEVFCDYSRNGYRLPTEVEWEFAARGGNASRGYTYAGGNTVEDVAWYFDNAGRYPNPVGMKNPNELGLFDMSGNAYEWTNNKLTRNYSALTDGEENPTGPSGPGVRTLRGGSSFFDSWGCQFWYRKGARPECRLPYIGFRVVRRLST